MIRTIEIAGMVVGIRAEISRKNRRNSDHSGGVLADLNGAYYFSTVLCFNRLIFWSNIIGPLMPHYILSQTRNIRRKAVPCAAIKFKIYSKNSEFLRVPYRIVPYSYQILPILYRTVLLAYPYRTEPYRTAPYYSVS
jgi:hypothetical protein